MRILFTIAISIILLGITSCSQNPGPCPTYQSKTFTRLIKDSIKQQIPFAGKDTLIYVSNYNDTAILYGKGLDNYILKSSILVSSDPDCPKYDLYNSEKMDYEFKGENPNLNFLFFRVYFRYLDDNTEFIITYLLNEDNRTIAAAGLYNYEVEYTSPVTIKGKTYYGIYFYGNNNKHVIYNKEYGFLQINLNDTIKYTLNNIKS